MKHVIRNDKGEIISGKMVLRKKGYGTGKISNNGQPEVDWKLLDECKNADNDGFDTEHVEPNGRHRMKVELLYDMEVMELLLHLREQSLSNYHYHILKIRWNIMNIELLRIILMLYAL